MRSAVVILLTLIIASTTSNAAAVKENSPCSGIGFPDLQNAEINDIKFLNKKGYSSDGLPNAKDWEHTIISDQHLKPSLEKEVRLIVINSNHLTGSGAWDTVIVFDCVRAKLNKIFEKKYLYGVKMNTNTDGELILTSGDWQPGDPNCCPSKETKEIYRWNQSKGTYILRNTVTQQKN